jgi:hypothetical protein
MLTVNIQLLWMWVPHRNKTVIPVINIQPITYSLSALVLNPPNFSVQCDDDTDGISNFKPNRKHTPQILQ